MKDRNTLWLLVCMACLLGFLIQGSCSDEGNCDCGDREICVDGACETLPDSCPCPTGSYCDEANDT